MVQRRDDRCGHQFHEFLDGVGSVAVALNHLAQSRLTPPLPAARCRDSLGLQRSLHRPHWHPRGYFLEDALYHAHSSLIHKVACAVLVKPEAVLGRVARDELALAGFPQLPLRVLSAVFARSNLASWSSMPSVSSPSGLSSPRSLRARKVQPYSANSCLSK